MCSSGILTECSLINQFWFCKMTCIDFHQFFSSSLFLWSSLYSLYKFSSTLGSINSSSGSYYLILFVVLWLKTFYWEGFLLARFSSWKLSDDTDFDELLFLCFTYSNDCPTTERDLFLDFCVSIFESFDSEILRALSSVLVDCSLSTSITFDKCLVIHDCLDILLIFRWLLLWAGAWIGTGH